MRFLTLAFLPACALACMSGYDIFFDGQCFKRINSGESFVNAKKNCAAQNSFLVMLHSEEEAKDYSKSTNDQSAWLDLACDGEKFVWGDGSEAKYTNFKDKQTCSPSLTDTRYIVDINKLWYTSTSTSTNYYCQAAIRSWICDNYDLVQLGKSSEMCFLLEKTAVSWAQAESNCQNRQAHIAPIHDQSMNDFVKRTAVNAGLEVGVHLGLQHENDSYVWSDGTAMDYDYFAPGFPDTQYGECVSMGTGFFPGKWMNMDCTSLLPYVCTKPALIFDDSVQPEGCADDMEFGPGDEIFSPTWGQATGPANCDYAIMDEDSTKKVTVTILFFESNNCCDKLTIYDGLFGDKVLKSFTGYVGKTSVVVTGTKNAIRMEWRASSGAHVRGWHAKVGAV